MNRKMINQSHCRGFSLISLMIAMLIGLFIIAAAGKIYLDSKSTFNARAAVSAVSENGRFAIQDFRRTLVMAGMGVKLSEADNSNLRAIPALGTITTIGATVDGGATASDAVAVRYRRGPSCGGYINNPTTETVRFLVDSDPNSVQFEQLLCERSVAGAVVSKQPLVSGVKLMKALYGVDDDSSGYANRYLTPAQVDAESKWKNIVSIRIGLVADSAEYSKPVGMRWPSSSTLSLLGMDYIVPANDEKVYRVFTTTVQLRNLNAIMQKQ